MLPSPSPTGQTSHELQYLAVLIVNILIHFDEDWLSRRPQIVTTLLKIWVSDEFQERHKQIVSLKEAK